MQDETLCLIKDHGSIKFTHVCTFKDCDQQSRWACSYCLEQKLHQHEQLANNHIMDQQQFKTFITQINKQEIQLKSEVIQQCQLKLDIIIKGIQKLQSYFFTCLQELNQKDLNDIQSQLLQGYFCEIQTQQISNILNKSHDKDIQQIDYNIQENIAIVIKQLEQLQNQVNENKLLNCNVLSNQKFQFDQYIQLGQSDCIFTAQISQNEQYLAYGGNEQLLIIYDLKLKQKLQQIKLNQDIYVCSFSEDSALLHIGCREGYLYCIDIKNNFKQIYKKLIHNDYIMNMVVIKNYEVITCSSQDIIITDILQDKQITIQNAHMSCINALDYDENKDIIASGSNDKSIKFFNLQKGLIIMSKDEAHSCEINQIQLICENKLLSLDGKCLLRLWQINQENDNLHLITQIQDENSITNFRYISKNQIILICDQYIKIVDQELNLKIQMKHSQGNDVLNRKVKQLKSLNYIIVPGENQFTVMKNQFQMDI